MKRQVRKHVIIQAAIIAAGGGLTSAQDFKISRYSFDGGGGMHSTGEGFELSGAVGQPDAGAMAGGSFQLSGGFWFAEPPGDCNATGNVDLIDFSSAARCLTGPEGGLDLPSCGCFDLDGDGDHDLWDIAKFQETFTGG